MLLADKSSTPPLLRGKRAIVIDDLGASVAIGRNMLMSLGAKQVDTAHDYQSAFILLARKKYDIVLCDFNLGTGLNGQQLLRDLRHIGRLSYTTLFIVVSAERTKNIVLGTIECEPDGYIAKPFTQGDFIQRLTRLVERQDAFLAFNQALDNKLYAEAFAEADKVRASQPKYNNLALRKKAGTLYELKQFEGALEQFDKALEKRPVTWAQIGRARCIAELGNTAQAIEEFENVIKNNGLAVPAIDSLATCQLREGRKKEAQATVLKAISLSPMSIERQRWLGELSMDIGEIETAVKANRSVIQLAQGTLKESVKQYQTFSRSLRKAIEEETDSKVINERIRDGRRVIKEGQKKFEDDESLKINDTLYRALDKFKQGDNEETIAIVDAAVARHKELLAEQPTLIIDIAETKLLAGDRPSAEAMLRKLMVDHKDNRHLVDQAQSILDIPLSHHQRVLITERNRQGKHHYDTGDYEHALSSFREALSLYPQHPSINLNAIQATLKLIESGKRSEKALTEAMGYLNAIVPLEDDHPEYSRKEAFEKYLKKRTKA
ncbi:tetratricopeptide repeat protein [Alkalimarinus alittae]|uniref:Tetratricopeptide repeat protein n=1 Tax=Alkalimarinus alittae TaxID=2961619 RepID=A0ABY6N0I6_9ALTE|nr:tetratricopeptide repeat protein [Alkalimarinus alittae]UZE95509.1 tetratricopeptide repeat protein [Alkalimarinus alittae]